MKRWVLHMDMDAFFASVEQLTRPTLRGRPVLVGGGVVAGASYEARAYGARSAMPMHQAKALVGFSAVVVQPRHEVYQEMSAQVFELVAQHAGVIEQLSIDEAFLEPAELAGATPVEVRRWAEQLRGLIRTHIGLPASIGAGQGKQFAKIASGQAKPDGVFIADDHHVFDEFPVRVLWGIGPVAQAKLQRIGVRTIADFAALGEEDVDMTLGATVGRALWQLARGHDKRPVEPRAVAKQISTEHTYPQDLTTAAEVTAAIDRAVSGAYRRLLNDGRGARTVTLKLKMSDFHTETRSQSLLYATDDEATLRTLAHKLARYPAETGAVRLVGVGFSNLDAARQHILFPELDQVEPIRESAAEPQQRRWLHTQDVSHPEFGHGWVQGAGHGIVSVRFETRTTKRGITRTFSEDDPELSPADPLDSLK